MRRLISKDLDENSREFLGTDKPKRTRGPNKARAREAVRAMVTAKAFEGTSAVHLVALYEYCHELVYGEPPLELENNEVWKLATFAAARLVKKHFDGDTDAAMEFVRWTWQRERSRKAYRERKGIASTRLGWRLQFRDDMVTDYRIAMRSGE